MQSKSMLVHPVHDTAKNRFNSMKRKLMPIIQRPRTRSKQNSASNALSCFKRISAKFTVFSILFSGYQFDGISGTLTEVPASAYKIVNAFNYHDNESARKEWSHGDKTTAVRIAKTAKRNVIELPVDCRNNSIPRTIWDLTLNHDFSSAKNIKLKIFCPANALEENLVIYFQSGNGWYRFNVSPNKVDEWSTVTLDPRFAAIEGEPSGWEKITKMRISIWHPKTTKNKLYIADLGAIKMKKGAVLVVRTDSSGKDYSFQLYTSKIVGILDSLHIPNRVTGDINWRENKLEGTDLIILPYNPFFPKETEQQILRFIEKGGKVLCFYTVPEKLASSLGFSTGEWLKHNFSYFKIDRKIIPDAPETVEQPSWNIYNAHPLGKRGQIAAYWYDESGKTDNAAIITTNNAIYMTHVLLNQNSEETEVFIMAALNYLLPDSAKERAECIVRHIGQIGSFDNLAQAVNEIRKGATGSNNDSIAKTLRKAEALKESAEKALSDKDYRKVLTLAKGANTAIKNAYFAIQKPRKKEFRGFWCHSPYGIEGLTWDQSIKKLADNGFTAIFPNMAWGGTAYYDSEVLPVASSVAEKGDQIKLCLAACRKYHIECHIWKVNWNTGNRAPAAFIEKLRKSHRLQVGLDGKTKPWLCPSHPANRKLEISAMLEIAKKYPVDGIHFDYIRYPSNNYCFCDGCRKRFERFAGTAIKNWPADVMKDDNLHQLWLKFRRMNITEVVQEVRKQVEEQNLNVKISAAVFSNLNGARDSVGQDWAHWCEKGLLDFACPMDYTNSQPEFRTIVSKQLAEAPDIPIYPGIGISCWQKHSSFRAADMIKITRDLNTGGFMLFQYDRNAYNEFVPLCGKGLTARENTPSRKKQLESSK